MVRWALCMTFWLGLTCHPIGSLHRFTGFSGWKAIRKSGGNPVGTQEKHVVPVWWDCGSFCTSGPWTSHHHLQQLLVWKGWTYGLASQVTRPHIDFLLWGHIKALILQVTSWLWIGSYWPYHWHGSNLALLWAHINLSCAVVGCVSRSVATCLNICSINWYEI
jgi:hypothetical protein